MSFACCGLLKKDCPRQTQKKPKPKRKSLASYLEEPVAKREAYRQESSLSECGVPDDQVAHVVVAESPTNNYQGNNHHGSNFNVLNHHAVIPTDMANVGAKLKESAGRFGDAVGYECELKWPGAQPRKRRGSPWYRLSFFTRKTNKT